MEHRHPGSNLLLVHPGSCLLRRLGNHLRKSRTDCVRTRTISWRRKRRHKELETHHQEMERHHQRLEYYRKELETPHKEAHGPCYPGTQLLLRPGSCLPFDLGRTECTASRGRQHEIQSKRRRNFRQHARQGSIGGNTPGNGSGFRDLDSPENELENLRARIKPTIQENVDKSLQQQNVSYRNAGSTLSGILVASPSGAAGPSLPEPDTETNRQLKRVHTFSIAEGHLRTNPETGSTESTQEDQEPLATSTAFVYTRKPTSGFLYFLNEGPINIGTLSSLPKM